MKVDFTVTQNCDCNLTITGESEYPEEEAYQQFKYEDTITINIITLEKVDGPQFVATTYSEHIGYLDESSIQLKEDGLYNITQLIVPSLKWYQRERANKRNNFFRYDTIIVSDGKNLYKVSETKTELLDALDFITEINTQGTTVSKNQKIIFSTCFLWKCYISLANEALRRLLKNNRSKGKVIKCGNEDEETKDIIYRRDFVWVTINILNYLTDECKFEEAQQILEEVMFCNGFCNSFEENIISNYFNNGKTIQMKTSCGCHS